MALAIREDGNLVEQADKNSQQKGGKGDQQKGGKRKGKGKKPKITSGPKVIQKTCLCIMLRFIFGNFRALTMPEF
jgi:hypothetical protein